MLPILGRFLVLGLVLVAVGAPAESRILRQRRVAPEEVVPQNRRILRKRGVIRTPAAPLSLGNSSFSILFHTPLIHENLYDGRFTGIGTQFLFSIPFYRWGETGYLHAEFGPGLSFANVALTQPETKFTHLYFLVPARVRALWAIGESTILEVGAGVIYRPFEYDSRPTTDGGFHSNVSVSKIEFDLNVGLAFLLSTGSRLRFTAGYQFLAGGIEFLL